MPRRPKKDPPKPSERRSAAWESFNPWEPMYWKRGGPFVPIDQIEPHWNDTHEMHPEKLAYWMKPKTRLVYAEEAIKQAEAELEKHVGYYLAYHEKGIDALANEWDRDSTRKILGDPARWDNCPTPLDYRRASSYRQIGLFRMKIAACKALIEQLDAPAYPLFHFRDDV